MELPQSANAPLAAPHRLSGLDLVRGFALLGIGLENLFTMHTQNAGFAEYAARYPHGFNHWLLLGLMVLIRSKFYPIFSFVFGAAAALSIPHRGKAYFLRRQGALFCLGVLQVLLVWDGDVLTQYALMGLVLLLLTRVPPPVLYGLAALLLLVSFTGQLWGPEVAEPDAFAQKAASVYQSGTFGEMVQVRWQSLVQESFTWAFLLFLCRIFSFLLLGYAFVRTDGLPLWDKTTWVRRTFLLFLALVGATAAVIQVAGWRGENPLPLSQAWGKQLLLTGYFFGLVGFYLLLPLLLRQWTPVRFLLQPLNWLGQHTLTHYLGQNLLFSLLFYAYGAGLYGGLAPWQGALLYMGIIAGQLWLSARWVRLGKRGPVEKLLRKWAGDKR